MPYRIEIGNLLFEKDNLDECKSFISAMITHSYNGFIDLASIEDEINAATTEEELVRIAKRSTKELRDVKINKV